MRRCVAKRFVERVFGGNTVQATAEKKNGENVVPEPTRNENNKMLVS